jgi:hypothetical protein
MEEGKQGSEATPLMMSKKKSIKKNITKEDKFMVNRAFKSKMKKI